MKKNIKYLLLLLIPILLFLYTNYREIKPRDNTIVKEAIEEPQSSTEILKEKYNNNDIIGSLTIETMDINEAVLQHTDNDYYLTHDNYGNEDKYGSVYMDYRNTKDSKKLLIFGHNYYNSGTPFSKLENYYEESFYKENQYIKLILDNEERIYHIFSAYVETSDFTYMNLKIDDSKYNSDLRKYKNNSFYDTGVEVNDNDEILILQTCSNSYKYKKYKDKFLLIIAKRIN